MIITNKDGINYFKCSRCRTEFHSFDEDYCPVCGHSFSNKPFNYNSRDKFIPKEHFKLFLNHSGIEEEFDVVVLESRNIGKIKLATEPDSQLSRRVLYFLNNGIQGYLDAGLGKENKLDLTEFVPHRITLENKEQWVHFMKHQEWKDNPEIFKVDYNKTCWNCGTTKNGVHLSKGNFSEQDLCFHIYNELHNNPSECPNCGTTNLWDIKDVFIDGGSLWEQNIVRSEYNNYEQFKGLEYSEEAIIIKNKKGEDLYFTFFEMAKIINVTFIKFIDNFDNEMSLSINPNIIGLRLIGVEFIDIMNSLWNEELLYLEKNEGEEDFFESPYKNFLEYLNNYFFLSFILKGVFKFESFTKTTKPYYGYDNNLKSSIRKQLIFLIRKTYEKNYPIINQIY